MSNELPDIKVGKIWAVNKKKNETNNNKSKNNHGNNT